jgi:mono/diheme cytochrome c family protein
VRRWAPLAVGLVAAGVAFAIVMATADEQPEDEGRASSAMADGTAAAGDGRAVFQRMGCGSCHTLAAAGSSGMMGPSLDERLDTYDADSLEATILNPPGSHGGFSAMPDDFGRRLSSAELDALVAFLLNARD